eukprot:1151315-Pelagomonas_calceolata.AAC.3
MASHTDEVVPSSSPGFTTISDAGCVLVDALAAEMAARMLHSTRGRGLQPADLADLAWALHVQLYSGAGLRHKLKCGRSTHKLRDVVWTMLSSEHKGEAETKGKGRQEIVEHITSFMDLSNATLEMSPPHIAVAASALRSPQVTSLAEAVAAEVFFQISDRHSLKAPFTAPVSASMIHGFNLKLSNGDHLHPGFNLKLSNGDGLHPGRRRIDPLSTHTRSRQALMTMPTAAP